MYKDGKIGVSGAIGHYSEKELESKAMEALSLDIPYPYEATSGARHSLDLSSQIFSEQQLLEETEEILSVLRESQPGFSFSHKIKIVSRSTVLENDRGTDLKYRDSYLSLLLVFKEKSSSNIMDGFSGYEGRSYNRAGVLELINGVCNSYKNVVDLPSYDLPVIFAGDEGSVFSKLVSELHGQRYATGGSLFSGKSGEKLFNDSFTLYQNSNPEETFSPFFDAEGTMNEDYRYALIDRGRIAGPYTDKKTAAVYKLPCTGSAVSDYDGVPRIGLTGIKVKESTKTTKELLGGNPGIFVMLSSGGDFTSSGGFAAPVQLAMLYDGEKFIGRLPELKLSSNLFDMFGKGFIGVGKDNFFPLSPTKCIVMDMKVERA